MSRPRFLADEDFWFEIILAVRQLEPGVDISTVVEIGRTGATDADNLDFANSNNLIVISHDVNTLKAEAELRIADGRSIAGVMLSAQRNPTRPVAESLVIIWAASEAEEWKDRIVFLPI